MEREITFALPGSGELSAARQQAARLSRILRNAGSGKAGTGALEELLSALSAAREGAEGLAAALESTAGDTVQSCLRELSGLVKGELSDSLAALGREIFGTTAEEGAQALRDEGKAMEETASSARRAVRALASFDEINALVFGRGGSGSRRRSAAAAAAGSEAEPALSAGERFDALLEGILSKSLPRLRRRFEEFADWLNGAAARLYEMFRFPGAADKVRRIGAELAEAVNGLVRDLDWAGLGAALGAGLDLAFQGLTALLYGLDAFGFGQSLAAFFNSAAAKIDWENLGRLLWGGFRLAIETLAGLLLGLDMGQLARAASGLAIGWFRSLQETLTSIDWDGIARQITAFLTGLDWAGVAEAVAGAMGAVLGSAAALLWGLIRSAWEGIAGLWRSQAEADGRLTMEGLWRGITEAWNRCVTFLREKILQPFVSGFRAVFGIHSPSTVTQELGRYLTDGLYLGIQSGISGVTELFRSIFDGFVSYVRGAFLTDWGSAWDSVTARFAGAWESMSGTLTRTAGSILEGVRGLMEQLGNVKFTVPQWVPGIGGQSVSLPRVEHGAVPHLAAGTVVPPNRAFLAMLGDNTRETEVVSPLSTMKQALLEALQEAGVAGGGSVTLTVNLDGREIARNQVRHINDMTRAAGHPVLLV